MNFFLNNKNIIKMWLHFFYLICTSIVTGLIIAVLILIIPSKKLRIIERWIKAYRNTGNNSRKEQG